MTKKRSKRIKPRGMGPELTPAAFEAMSPEEKEAVYKSVDRKIPFSETWPLSPEQRKLWRRFQKKAKGGRPKIGKGSRVVAVSVEQDRLKRINAFLKQRGLGRSELFLRGIELAMAEIERKERRAS